MSSRRTTTDPQWRRPEPPTRLLLAEQPWHGVVPGLHPYVLHDDTGHVYVFADDAKPEGAAVVVCCDGRSETAAALADSTPTAS